MKDSNPFNHMVMINGLMMPISVLPEELQQLVHKARAEGKDISFTNQ